MSSNAGGVDPAAHSLFVALGNIATDHLRVYDLNTYTQVQRLTTGTILGAPVFHAATNTVYLSGSGASPFVAPFQGPPPPPPPTAVAIDITPGAFPNTINLGSAGVIPLAILSSPTFDAQEVDPATVTLAGASVKLIGKGDQYAFGLEDANGDALPDLRCYVMTAQFALEVGDSIATLEAATLNGQRVRGEDSIQIVPWRESFR